MDKKTLKDLIICAILVIVFGFLLSYAFEPEPVEYIPPNVSQEDVDQLFAVAMDKADRVSYKLEKELIRREVIQEHIEEAQNFGHSSHLDP